MIRSSSARFCRSATFFLDYEQRPEAVVCDVAWPAIAKPSLDRGDRPTWLATGNGGNAALRRRSREHPAVQSETADLRGLYERLRVEHGFRYLDYSVDSDAVSPRACFQFSENLPGKRKSSDRRSESSAARHCLRSVSVRPSSARLSASSVRSEVRW